MSCIYTCSNGYAFYVISCTVYTQRMYMCTLFFLQVGSLINPVKTSSCMMTARWRSVTLAWRRWRHGGTGTRRGDSQLGASSGWYVWPASCSRQSLRATVHMPACVSVCLCMYVYAWVHVRTACALIVTIYGTLGYFLRHQYCVMINAWNLKQYKYMYM